VHADRGGAQDEDKDENMLKRFIKGLLGAIALTAALPALGASISLQPSPAQVQQTQGFTLSLLISATEVPGDLHGGLVIIDFDPTLLSYDSSSLALQTGISFFEPLSVGSSGGRQTLSFGFDNAPDTGTVATMTFTAIGAAGSTASIGIADGDDFSGSFASYYPTYQRFYPDFTGTSVELSAIPLPGAAWLLVTALTVVATRARRIVRPDPAA
jgi:hypothetical protein